MSAQQDKAFVRTFVGVLAILVAVIVLLIVLAVGLQGNKDPEQVALDRERAEARLQPVAQVYLSGEPLPVMAQAEPAGAATESLTADQVVQQICAGCHAAGVPGAPQIGAAGDWEPRLANGLEAMVQNAITGIGAMPPKGGNAALSDEQVHEAVVEMLEQSGLDVE